MSSSASRIKIFEALTAKNPPPIPFNDDTVWLSEPSPNLDPLPQSGDDWNTMVTVIAKPGSGYSGSVNVFYRRVDLQRFAGTEALMRECKFTPQAIIDALNKCYLSFLSLEDLHEITEADLPCATGVVRCLTLTALDNSLGWIGTVTLPVVFGIPKEASRLHWLLNHTMPAPGYW